MDENVLLRIGRVIKTHGVIGAILIAPDSEDTNRLLGLSSVFIGGSTTTARKYDVVDLRIHKVKKHIGIVATLKTLDSIEDADRLREKFVYANSGELPDLSDDELFLDDLPGCIVLTSTHEEVGVVKEWVEYPSQLMLIVTAADREYLIPMVVPDIVAEIDLETRKLVLADWEGLLDE